MGSWRKEHRITEVGISETALRGEGRRRHAWQEDHRGRGKEAETPGTRVGNSKEGVAAGSQEVRGRAGGKTDGRPKDVTTGLSDESQV